MSVEQTYVDNHDADLEALEESLDRGEPWRYPIRPDEEWDAEMPNPLVIRVTGISAGPVNGEELPFVNGVDARGKKWSRIIGSKALRDGLLDGIVSKWDDERQAFVEVDRVGPVQPGERVALTFRGFSTIKSGPHKGKEIPNVKVERPDAGKSVAPVGGAPSQGSDIPFGPVL